MSKAVVLFNDNDPVLARVARVKLKNEAGWDVVITSNYDEALAAVNEQDPNLLITELILTDEQGRTGFDLIASVKQNDATKEMPVIVLSDLKQEEDKQEAMQKGADYYFVKSEIGIKDLIEKVQMIMEDLGLTD